jgi:two-component system, NtrC family, nitrogen regulation response regulator GlnG
MANIWIVDDDASIRFVLDKALQREGFAVRSFGNAPSVLEALDAAEAAMPQVLISDIRMPGGSGLDLLATVKARLPSLPIIIMTAFSDLDSAVSAFQGGAFDYLSKPFDLNHALELVRRAMAQHLTHTEEAALEQQPDILGQSSAMQEVFRVMGRLSQSQVTVLITGETGTGKERIAHALHKHSPRAKGPFVAINTAAIPKDLLESELFGHERGAFTGAQSARQGRFEQANSGTLFLDEIGDMPYELQTRLLRVLSDGHFYRVGGQQAVRANVRIIAATHQDLEQRVKEGVFREDLLHRLNVIRLRLPPLRERVQDIPMLAKHFLQASAAQLGGEAKRLSEAAEQVLLRFAFPGNVRQLENMCHWLTVMAPGQQIEVQDLPPEVLAKPPSTQTAELHGHVHVADSLASAISAMPTQTLALHGDWSQALQTRALDMLQSGQKDVWPALQAAFEARLIEAALKHTRGKRVEAAERLGIGRNTLTRKMQDLGLSHDEA